VDGPSSLELPRIVALVRASTDAAVGEVRALGEWARVAPAPGEWCANQILGHLVEADRRGFVGRIRAIMSADRPRFEAWDQPAVATARGDDERDPESIVAEFLVERAEGVRLVAALEPASLARVGVHPQVGELSVSDLLHEWVHHDREHLAQLLAASRSFAWPAMGNARRFSDPSA
jgi:hypothetical protein